MPGQPGPGLAQTVKQREEALCGNNNIGFETEYSTGPGGLCPESSLELFDPAVVRTCSGGGSASHHCLHTRAVSLPNLSPAGP